MNNHAELIKNSNCRIALSNTPLLNIHEDNWNFIKTKEMYIYYQHRTPQDITFIVQGLEEKDTFLKLIFTLLEYGHVQLATWDSSEGLDLKSTEAHIRKNGIHNEQNIYYQVISTWYGLEKCKTKFAIKVRADEWYENFTPFIECMRKNPHKIVTLDLFFRTLGQYPYHISDHIIGGKTTYVFKMFDACRRLLENKGTLPNMTRLQKIIPEQWLTVSYLRCFYSEDIITTRPRENMISRFEIVPLETFENFTIRYRRNSKRHIIRNKDDLKNHEHAFTIRNINDIGENFHATSKHVP
jgi:hypothetical protein